MAFELPALPYATDALEPHIDKLTMEIHHGRHYPSPENRCFRLRHIGHSPCRQQHHAGLDGHIQSAIF
jgi:superoxide dismutase